MREESPFQKPDRSYERSFTQWQDENLVFEVLGWTAHLWQGMHKGWCLAEMEAQRGVRKHLPTLRAVVLHRSVSQSGYPMWGAEVLTWLTEGELVESGQTLISLPTPPLPLSLFLLLFHFHWLLSLHFLPPSPCFVLYICFVFLILTVLFSSLEHLGAFELSKCFLFCSVWDFLKG